MIWILLVRCSLCIQLIPEFCSGITYIYNTQEEILITFTKQFTSTPQVLMNGRRVYMHGNIDSQQTKVASITQNGFILFSNFTHHQYLVIEWMAFLDDNINSQIGSIQNMVLQINYQNITLLNPQANIPTAAVFLTGINYTSSANNYKYQVMITSISSTSILLVVNITSGSISQLDFNIIYGSPQYLIAGVEEFYPLPLDCHQWIFYPKIKVYQAGFSGLYYFDSSPFFEISEQQGQICVYSGGNVNSVVVVVSYFRYMPCPLYCTTCNAPEPYCDGCLVSTYRIGSDCATCQAQTYLIPGQIDCQKCGIFCGQCTGSPNNCTFCLASTFRREAPNCEICQSQYFSLTNEINCQPCVNYCNECIQTAQNCLACLIPTMRTNPPSCTTCPPQYHVVYNIYNCQPCSPYCNNCLNFTFSCIACNASALRLNPPACIDCPQQYYTDGDTCTKCDSTCQTCNSNTCLTCILQEYRVINLTCQFCPQKCIACDQYKNCYMEPQNCQLGIYINRGFIQCTRCQSNYYLQDNFCIKCSPQCLECNQQPQFCTICRFSSLNSIDCQLCESQAGMYSNYDTNTCYSICGDGIVSLNEQCDDGNLSPQDGCTNCKIEPGYFCEGSVCQAIIYPIPFIAQNTTLDTVYNADKTFLLSYNVPLTIKVPNLKLRISNFTLYNYELKQIDDQLYSISIILTEQLINAQLELTFINTNEITSDQGFQQQISSISCSISDYIQQTNTEQNISDSTNTAMNYLFIVLAIIILSAILFGGLEMFWNLLDLFQIMSYLKYVNTVKPYYLYQFFNLFGFIQISNLPLNQLFNIQDYVQNAIDISEFQAPPSLISNDRFTTSTIVNIIPILNVIFTGICIYFFALITIILLDQMTCFLNPNYLLNNIKIMKFIYKLKSCLIYSSRSIITQFFWSGLIRIFISSAYDICFTISLGTYGLQLKNYSYLIKFDFSMTMFLAFCYFLITWLIVIVASFNSNTLRQTIQKYGAVCEGLKLRKQLMKQNAALNLMKKMLFMIILVLLYNEPIFQILNIVAIQIYQLLFLIIIDPLADKKEKQKQILCEFFMLIAEIQLAILVIDDYWTIFIYEKRRIFGWICLIALVIITLSHIAIDAHRQAQLYYKRYPTLRRYWRSVKNIFQGQPVAQVSLQEMII